MLMMHRPLVVAEIGINHNGDLALAKRLVRAARDCGCDLVKFQKRTVECVYTRRRLMRLQPNPFGERFLDLKKGLEFGGREFAQIDRYCRRIGMPWFASCWDSHAVDMLACFHLPFIKVPSLRLSDETLLRRVRCARKPVIISAGACGEEAVSRALAVVGRPRVAYLLQCTAIYPPRVSQLNLNYLLTLKRRFNLPVGISCHYPDPALGVFAAGLGAQMIEFHLTLDRASWGSDQAASLVPEEMSWLVNALRRCARAAGDRRKHFYPEEKTKLRSYRAVAGAMHER